MNKLWAVIFGWLVLAAILQPDSGVKVIGFVFAGLAVVSVLSRAVGRKA